MEKKIKSQSGRTTKCCHREQEPKSKPKYEPPKVLASSNDEIFKQMGDEFEVCPPATCHK